MNAVSKRILIVEDDANIAISLEFLMQQAGYSVRVAGDGEQALAAADEFQPHLIMLDIMLPARNGFEVCQTLRASTRHAGVKIVMLTARGRDAEIARGYELGADAYATKPFATRELTATVRRLLDAA